MVERIGKCIICLALIPVFWATLIVLAITSVALPLVALVSPESIKLKEGEPHE